MQALRPGRLVWPIAACLALAPGCSWVHQRQAFSLNTPKRVGGGRDNARRNPPPRVNLHVSPEWGPERTADRND